jgi:hypothetical protein
MAEINVVRKDRTWWPWIAGLLIAIALAWYFASRNNVVGQQASRRAADTTVTEGRMQSDSAMRDSSTRGVTSRDTSMSMVLPPMRGPIDSTRPPR